MRAVLVSQLRRCFLDGGSMPKQFKGLLLAVFIQPCNWSLAHFIDEVPLQGAQGDAAMVSHALD